MRLALRAAAVVAAVAVPLSSTPASAMFCMRVAGAHDAVVYSGPLGTITVPMPPYTVDRSRCFV